MNTHEKFLYISENFPEHRKELNFLWWRDQEKFTQLVETLFDKTKNT